jgi:hypothetical protein
VSSKAYRTIIPNIYSLLAFAFCFEKSILLLPLPFYTKFENMAQLKKKI